jgi:hypothetical protein
MRQVNAAGGVGKIDCNHVFHGVTLPAILPALTATASGA